MCVRRSKSFAPHSGHPFSSSFPSTWAHGRYSFTARTCVPSGRTVRALSSHSATQLTLLGMVHSSLIRGGERLQNQVLPRIEAAPPLSRDLRSHRAYLYATCTD